MLVFSVLAALALLAVVAIRAALSGAAKRRKELMSLALRLGFQFVPNGSVLRFPFLQREKLQLFNIGHSRQATNLLMGRSGDSLLYSFDYSFVVGDGKNTSRLAQTVVVFSAVGMALPAFTVDPEGVLNKLLDFRDINFDEYPDFSKNYWLKSSEDGQALKAVFHGGFMGLLEGKRGWHIYSDGQFVMFFKHSKQDQSPDGDELMPVGDYERYLRDCKAMFDALSANLAAAGR